MLIKDSLADQHDGKQKQFQKECFFPLVFDEMHHSRSVPFLPTRQSITGSGEQLPVLLGERESFFDAELFDIEIRNHVAVFYENGL